VQPEVDEVFSVYNSFRLEHADASHLSEFHHVEFEGRYRQDENEGNFIALLGAIIGRLLEKEEASLRHFLTGDKIAELETLTRPCTYRRLRFQEALDLLYDDTREDRYRRFTMSDTFGAWEEVRLTWICEGPVLVSQFPLLEVPFYHAEVTASSPPVANNGDLIWPGCRETIGSGQRIDAEAELEAKARIFNLPREDYEPYLRTRSIPGWRGTSGFGLGWERMLQGLLEMPAIWDVCHFPRTHVSLRP
jgi:aspartyl/asparaginyl-tRNA synthetase